MHYNSMDLQPTGWIVKAILVALPMSSLVCAPSDGDPSKDDENNGNPVCQAKSCAEIDADCGTAPDGCGGTVDCGICDADQTCGAGGANTCGTGTCEIKTCEDLGAQCGYPSDGCADVLDCGTCPGNEICGDAYSCCTPTRQCSDISAACGRIDDGCGRIIDCGDCPAHQSCGGDGVPNQCGMGSCTPKTCEELGAECGNISDGCGSTLSCGDCEGHLTCGGGGLDNLCGADCPVSCPIGYACDDLGVCHGALGTSLDLDVSIPDYITLTGTFTTNGVEVLMRDGHTSGCVDLSFHNQDGLEGKTVQTCKEDGWVYEADLWAGTYLIKAGRDDWEVLFPSSSVTVVERILLSSQ